MLFQSRAVLKEMRAEMTNAEYEIVRNFESYKKRRSASREANRRNT